MLKLECRGCNTRHDVVLEALRSSLLAVHPSRVIPRVLSVKNRCLYLGGERLGCSIPVYVVGFGKASVSMAEALLESGLGEFVAEGVVIAPSSLAVGSRVGPIRVLPGNHPVPGRDTLHSSLRLLDFVESVPRDSMLIVLASGGGSALFEIPEDGVPLDALAAVTKELLRRGADIYELNTVRKHLSKVKGGKLLRYTRARLVVTLIMSDVPGDNPSFVASGPTVPDETTCRDALSVIERYRVSHLLPPEALRNLMNVPCPYETVKHTEKLGVNVKWYIVARNYDALLAAKKLLESRGYRVLVLTDTLRGEAREVAKTLASITEAMARDVLGYNAVLCGGETTVTVRGRGVGGRNQELCLAYALSLDKLKLVKRYVAACMGTDGVDGVSPAAGAIVDEATIVEARSLGLDPLKHLDNNDSYTLFSRLGRTLDTGGYTGVNVNDVFISVVGPG